MTATLPTNAFTLDEAARIAVRSALDTTMLVEAGAGSGKTTLMVDRLVAYIVRGTPVDEIAAVTFTKKAANELRERLETRLESEASNENRPALERERVRDALADRERLFIGTVHAFCGRVLREHAFDAGLPPDFTELDERESISLRSKSWHGFLERGVRDGNPLLLSLLAVGVDPYQLANAFAERDRYRDINFPATECVEPAHANVRGKLVALIEASYALRDEKTDDTRDELQQTLDRLWRGYRLHGKWESAAHFAQDCPSLLASSKRKVTQYRWGNSKPAKDAAKAFGEDVDDFVANELQPWFEMWWAFTYPQVVSLLSAASESALQERRRHGQLGFDDLLTETARLLRDNAGARRTLGNRWRHLLVDEFQDTDPVQAEVCFLIASDVDQGTDWKSVVVRPGSLFVVGDPKQSIYRFRRADLSVYRLVEQRIALCGQVVRLTRNFRSVPSIGRFVNAQFEPVFPSAGSASPALEYQAPFAPMVAAAGRPLSDTGGVWYYRVGPAAKANNDDVAAEDAARVASWITHRCNVTRDRRPQDFLILTPRTKELAQYAHELALRNVPVSATGAASAAHSVIVELLVILRAIADPANNVAVIAALEGLCAGCSHEDLWNARATGLEFSITHEPNESVTPVGSALRQFYAWWILSQQLPVASLLERIMSDSGLLLLAASDDLGDRNAGQLLQLVSILQDGNVAGADLRTAIELIDQTLQEDSSDATLRPGRTDTVRLMNLHKAKGLEAPVVILAAPLPKKLSAPTVATWRDAQGNAAGAIQICDDHNTVIARPSDWRKRAADEEVRVQAERDRLLYVATTRAQDELVVARRRPYLSAKILNGDEGAWAPLSETLEKHAKPLVLEIAIPQGRRTLHTTATEIAERVARANARRVQASAASYALVSVTEAIKQTAVQAADDGLSAEAERHQTTSSQSTRLESNDGPQANARAFGSLVHAAIEAAMRGRSDIGLVEYVNALVWHQFPDFSEELRARVVGDVMQAVSQARQSDAWAALHSAATPPLPELNVARYANDGGFWRLVEGVVDAAVKLPAGWLVVDWKNHSGLDANWDALGPDYRLQAAAYLSALEARDGVGGTISVVRIRGSTT